MSNQQFEEIKKILAASLQSGLLADCNPPPDAIDIPFGSIRADQENPGKALATVNYITHRKDGDQTHTVNIRFGYTPEGKFITESLEYV